MKVGILTFHNTSNYGAAFQAYATQESIISLGHSAEVIDYVNSKRKGKYDTTSRIKALFSSGNYLKAIKFALGSFLIEKRNNEFNNFYRSYLKVSSDSYNEDSVVNSSLNYDVILSGSDQVWSYKNNGGDINYALAFAGDKKRVSYASSFGVADYPQEMITKFEPHFSAIDVVSVRESSGADLFKVITGKKAKVVLDPVFLLSKDKWLKLAGVKEKTENSGVFCYFNNRKYLATFLKEKGTFLDNEKIIQVSSDFELSNIVNPKYKFSPNISPIKFLKCLYNSTFVATSSFHGVVLSIIFEKDFVVFLSGDTGRDSRIKDLLERLGLESRAYVSGASTKLPLSEMNYSTCQARLDELIYDSKSYLKKAL